MSKIRFFPGLVMAAVILAACSPASRTASTSQAAIEPSPTASSVPNTSTAAPMALTEAPSASPLPLATSRGPELHATDPATVNVASGGLQLVEFFRFT